ncbi:MAG: tetratricopeptide repeat protein [Lewinellaceae bacterium]|nr:tetratricopeptide repeat protein [Phaeodactylibacter sp.]MCB9039267.1 tetratricopeptide repeat protein [Lewinellaceae bacterium]
MFEQIQFRHCFRLLFLFAFPLTATAGSAIDTATIHQYFRNAESTSNPDSTEYWYLKAMRLSEESEYYECLFDGARSVSGFYVAQNRFQDAEQWLNKGLQWMEEGGSKAQLAAMYNELGILKYYQGEIPVSIGYFRQAIPLYESDGSAEQVANAYSNLANLLQITGNWVASVENYLKALKLFEEIGLQNGVGTTLYNIGVLYYDNGRDSLAVDYFFQAEDILRQGSDSLYLAQVLTSIADHYSRQEKWQDGEQALLEALSIFESFQFPVGIATACNRLGGIYLHYGQLGQAEQYLGRAYQLAETMSSDQETGWTLMNKARLAKERGQYQTALEHARRSLGIFEELGMKDNIYQAHELLSDIHAAFGYYELALEAHRTYNILKDSFITNQVNRQISELQVAYDTEKKDKEIVTLQQEAQLLQLRYTLLAGTLLAALLIGGLFYNRQRLKHRKDRQLREQEQRLEAERLRTAKLEKEQLQSELNHKKQELAAQVLHLCRKNEMLLSIREQLDNLEGSATTAQKAQSLSRQISRDLSSDEDWEAFLESFRSVHRDFFGHLAREYPSLTTNEIRLASLMKLNLSTKEIATLLNITPDGVKKARYRLRKKMALDSEVNIQDFILRYPAVEVRVV